MSDTANAATSLTMVNITTVTITGKAVTLAVATAVSMGLETVIVLYEGNKPP